jgi:peroxiredoxin Q/BCP
VKKIFCAFAILFCLNACQTAATDAPQAGTEAPAFTLPSQDGKDISLSDYRGKWVVLYFYPKDFSHGCTIEAHNFQQDIAKYHAINAIIIGVSGDDVGSHKDFCVKQGLDFKLLADTKHSTSNAYGAVMERKGETLSARSTFLIDPLGIIRKVYTAVEPASHSQEVLADLKRLQSKKE